MILSGQLEMDKECPFFAARRGLLRTQSNGWGTATPLTVAPTGWLREKAGLRRDYRFVANPVQVVHDGKRMTKTDAGYFLRYGKGAVFFFPFNRFYDPNETYETPAWQDYRQLLSDVTRGVLHMMGKEAAANRCLAAPGTGYMQATSDDSRITASVLDNTQRLLQQPFIVTGCDMFTGIENPGFGPNITATLTTPCSEPAARH